MVPRQWDALGGCLRDAHPCRARSSLSPGSGETPGTGALRARAWRRLSPLGEDSEGGLWVLSQPRGTCRRQDTGPPSAFRSPVGSPPSSKCPHPCRAPSGPRESLRSWGRRGQELQGQVGCVSPCSLPRLGLGRPRLQAVTCLAVITGDFRGFAFLPGPRLGNNFHHRAVPEKELSTCMAQPRPYPGSSAGTGDVGALLAPSWVHPGHCRQPHCPLLLPRELP